MTGTANSTSDKSFRHAMMRPPSFGGSLGALVFAWYSFGPSLLPRWWVMQFVITGLAGAIGYLIGTTLEFAVRIVAGRFGMTGVSAGVARGAWIGVGVVGLVVVGVGLGRWPSVQNASRDLVGLGHVSGTIVVVIAVASLVLFLLMVALGRLTLFLVRKAERFAQRFMPRALAWGVTLAVLAVVIVVFSVDVVEKGAVGFVDERFGAADNGTTPGVQQPMAPEYSGSPASTVGWETLGLEGRNFVAGAPTPPELAAFSETGAASTPVRVYAGLDSAATLEQRAALVVLELDRTKASEREVVVVVTTTGTGWVDPDAAEAIEFMYGGDTAIAAMQYSFLPSWIQFLVGTELAGEAGAAINAAAYAWWDALAEPRPKLLLFGESLGSLGLETALAGASLDESLATLSQSNGVLMTGPTASNPIWQQLSVARDADSPVWKPLYDGGSTVRAANQPQDPPTAGTAPWEQSRTLYFHHPSDPVGYWNLKTLWSRPEWVNDPIGYDVSPEVTWFPIVTWGQVSADLIAGFSAGPGFGHNYSVDFVSGWAAVAPPDSWTDDDTVRLSEHLDARAG